MVSKAIGAPVQIVDSRAGYLQHDYYRPLAVQRIRAGADDAGRIVAGITSCSSCSRGAYRQDGRPPHSTEVYGCYVGAAKTAAELDPDLAPMRIANARLKYGPLATGVPTGAWRAPSHMAVAFAVESTIDEIARLSGRSPVDVRLELLGDTADVPKAPEGYQYDPARMKRVLQAAAERGGIGSRPGDGRARGIAGHFTFGLVLRPRRGAVGGRREARHRAPGDVGRRLWPAGEPARRRSPGGGRRGDLRRAPRSTARSRSSTAARRWPTSTATA